MNCRARSDGTSKQVLRHTGWPNVFHLVSMSLHRSSSLDSHLKKIFSDVSPAFIIPDPYCLTLWIDFLLFIATFDGTSSIVLYFNPLGIDAFRFNFEANHSIDVSVSSNSISVTVITMKIVAVVNCLTVILCDNAVS